MNSKRQEILLLICNYIIVFAAGMGVMALLVNYLGHTTTFHPEEWTSEAAYGFWHQHNSTDSFYCVWTDNRWHDDVATTDYHEACHELVHKDYDHFCDHNH